MGNHINSITPFFSIYFEGNVLCKQYKATYVLPSSFEDDKVYFLYV